MYRIKRDQPPVQRDEVEMDPKIIVPDVPSGPACLSWFDDGNNELLNFVTDCVESTSLNNHQGKIKFIFQYQ